MTAQSNMTSGLPEKELQRIEALSYEEARDELVKAVQVLESGGLSLEESMLQWQRGAALAKRANALLQNIREQLDKTAQEQAEAGKTAGTQANIA